jgi:hypothetical protein
MKRLHVVLMGTAVSAALASGAIGQGCGADGSTYFGVDPKLDMIYIMMEQTQNERTRITPIFRKLVYDAFPPY